MPKFLVSLDELDYVKRSNGINTTVELARRTGMSRTTWVEALETRKPTPRVLEALASLGARPSRVLVSDDDAPVA